MKRVHVVAAVIEGTEGGPDSNILLSKRPEHLHQGGKWEFPGGKVEAREAVTLALHRELKEELDIEVKQAEPLIKISHDYPDKKVLLDVWRVTHFTGNPRGCEGQAIRWVAKSELIDYDFPAANQPIVSAAQLPREYVISPEIGISLHVFLQQLTATVEAGAELIQLRTKSATASQWVEIERSVHMLRHRYPVRFLLNSDISYGNANLYDGVHLTSSALMSLQSRPQGNRWVAASCHNLEQLAQARRLGVDFVTISPVHTTSSHPQSAAMGEAEFSRLVALANLPAYALGGMQRHHLEWCIDVGAQGIAAITGLWRDSM